MTLPMQPAARLALAVTLLSGSLASRAATAADEAPPTFLVLPLEAEGASSDLGFGLSLRILATLRAVGGSNLVHPKMLARVEERYDHRLDKLNEAGRRRLLGEVLGADAVLYGTSDKDLRRLELRLETVHGDNGKPLMEVVRGDGFSALVAALPEATLALVKKAGHLEERALPSADRVALATGSRQALIDYASCHRMMIRQPLGIQNPVVVDESSVRFAMEECTAALAHEPKLWSAKADLALGHAFLGDKGAAERLLSELKDTPAFLPTYWLSRFWILSRYHDVRLALESLEQAIERHPGFMLGRGYLAEALLALGEPKKAIAVLEAYLARCPRQSYVMGQIGYAYAKAKDLPAAIEWTEKALARTPGDPELLMQMGSRLIDANRFGDAASVLARVVGEGGARGEVYLRLGYAHLMNGDFGKAEQLIRTAITKAEGPAEWRTRGRARYNLAQLWLRSGSPENAIRQLRQARLEGFIDEAALAGPALAPLKKHPDFKKLERTKPRPGSAPAYVSPLGRATSSASLELRGVRATSPDRKILERL